MKIGILSIGDEVVIGKTINTNAAWLSKHLNDNNYVVSKHLTVRDEHDKILEGFKYLFKDANIVITTGGLGPTVDDITKEVTADFFKEKMILNDKILGNIKSYFEKQGQTMPETNVKQAYFISDAIIIGNGNGTAPGMIYEKKGKIIINLPGPPKELHPMFIHAVLPYLKDKLDIKMLKKGYRVMNIGESHAETLLSSLYNKYQNIKIAPYASVGVVDYIISSHNIKVASDFTNACKDFENIMEPYIIGDLSKHINEIIIEELSKRKLTLAIAESCTGGMLSSYIVDVRGSSNVFKQGHITYSNEAKINELNVKQETLESFGAVSMQTATEMAMNVATKTNCDIGLSTTGIAGPDGGTDEKPVGLVYTAIYYKGETKVYKHQFSGDRSKVRLKTCMTILYNLYKDIIKTL